MDKPRRAAAEAEHVLIPPLDIFQSIPVFGFLSVTGTAFIALFRGSLSIAGH